MRCEVIAVGTELLLGQIVDSNSAWMGEQLALAGIDCHFQTKVGDNLGRIVAAIRLALERAEAVVLCGGLGPTQDDITREAIAGVMGVALVRQPEIAARIRGIFESRGREMAANNLRQADVPVGASVIAEMPGTAPGLICPLGEQVIYAVPGVPHEMRTMMAASVIPDMQRRAGVSAVITSRVLRTWGHTESGLAEMLAERIEELDAAGNPTLAFQASGIEGLKVRITAKAADQAAAHAIIAAEESRVRAILGGVVFGVDHETMESVVLDLLRARGLSLAVAEPLTGGLMAMRLTDVPGAAEVVRGIVVPVQPESQAELLPASVALGITAEAAQAMAAGVRERFDADVGLAALGVVDAEESAPPPGTVLLGLATAAGREAREVRLPGARSRIRQYAVISLLDFLRRRLLEDTSRCIESSGG
jgi:nicotinamide-nucleotide amidase